jgi:hypothetical protein
MPDLVGYEGMNSDEAVNLLELDAERRGQIEGATLILKPLTFIAVVVVFALCFWRFDLGLVLSIVATIFTLPIISLTIAFPVGQILGRRAARRLKARMGQAAVNSELNPPNS